jgi:hypothetical protein
LEHTFPLPLVGAAADADADAFRKIAQTLS